MNQTRVDKVKAMIRAKLDARIKAREAAPKAPPPRYDEEFYKGVLWVDSLAYSPEETKALNFYMGGPDDKGRLLTEMISWDDEKLEKTHDYIQWMFPTDQPSEFNPNAPIISVFEMDSFNNNPALRQQLSRSVIRFTHFLENTSKNWMVKSNHNHLRISRMLRCMTLLGMQTAAKVLLYKFVARTSGIVNDTSIQFWKEAVEV